MDTGFITARLPELIIRTREHLFLTGISTGVAVLAGVPAGIYIAKKKFIKSAAFSTVGIIQTVPSLAMLAFLLAALGKIGPLPAIIALILYALLPIIQNTVTGLEHVPPDTLEASRGMGMTAWQQMYMVRLPLAMPVIIAGIKTAAVISVGIATLSAFIGAGGLGEFINRGLALSDTGLIMLGAVPSAILALYVSFSITAIEWGLDERRRKRFPLLAGTAGKYAAFIPLLLLFLLGITGQVYHQTTANSGGKVIKVGSKNFTEQLILGELIAQRLENVGLKVTRKFNLGGTMICQGALEAGEIDIYPEYTGTALLAVLNSKTRPTDPDAVYATVSRQYEKRFHLKWLPPLGFNNTYALAVRRKEAKKFDWRTISDLVNSAPSLRAGFTAEFSGRPDGYPGLRKVYDIKFGQVIDLDPSLMYKAIKDKQVDVITAFSTDSRVQGYNLFLLRDDKAFFPPYYAAPVVRMDTLRQYPAIKKALAPLGGLIDAKTMRSLNFQVDMERRPVKEVVRKFLRKNGLQD